VIHFSSAQVFGTAEGERQPDYFPVDDAHPRRAMRPYGNRRSRVHWQADPASEWEPYWEFGAFVDARDVATATAQAVQVPLTGHHRLLLCAAAIAATAPAMEMAARLAPGVPIRDPARYRADPWRALMDCSAARSLLSWRPGHSWSG
jgi:UDP-glucose 4-epimerase